MATTKKAAEKAEVKKSVFATLNAIDCSDHVEKKNGLTYLSWAWAWSKVKENYPDAFYTIYENEQGYIYHHDNRTAWVKTGVTIEGQELIECLPVMDFRNNSIPVDKLTSFDVNKAVQRSLTKACARHGLGLYIYAGEDLPESAKQTENKPAPRKASWKYKADATCDEVADMMRHATTMEDVRNIYLAYPAYQAELVEVGKEMQSVLSNN